MAFRFQRRLNLSKGWGVNISKSGMSLSLRSKHGSISSKGFSLRTGIPGLNYRYRAKKGSGEEAIFAIVMFVVALIPIAFQLVLQLLMFSYWLFIVVPSKLIAWCVMTLKDYISYKQVLDNKNTKKIQQG